jgi:hypothetical protein
LRHQLDGKRERTGSMRVNGKIDQGVALPNKQVHALSSGIVGIRLRKV